MDDLVTDVDIAEAVKAMGLTPSDDLIRKTRERNIRQPMAHARTLAKLRIAIEALGTIEAHEVDHAVSAAQNVEDISCIARTTLAQLRSPDHG